MFETVSYARYGDYLCDKMELTLQFGHGDDAPSVVIKWQQGPHYEKPIKI